RVRCCLAGAMATPAGLATAPPAVGTFSAVAAPCGSAGWSLGCGALGVVRPACPGVAPGCVCWSAPEASGEVVTGCSGAVAGFTVVPLAGILAGWLCDCPDSGVCEPAAGGAVVCWEPAGAGGVLAVWAHACWASNALITNKALTILVVLWIFME